MVFILSFKIFSKGDGRIVGERTIGKQQQTFSQLRIDAYLRLDDAAMKKWNSAINSQLNSISCTTVTIRVVRQDAMRESDIGSRDIGYLIIITSAWYHPPTAYRSPFAPTKLLDPVRLWFRFCPWLTNRVAPVSPGRASPAE